jgi:hypothetical protein
VACKHRLSWNKRSLRESIIAQVRACATATAREHRISTVVLFDRFSCVVRNTRHPLIDIGQPDHSTELVEVDSDTPFVLSQ